MCAGSDSAILAALGPRGGGDKLMKLASALSDPNIFRECAMHGTGNFVLQNMIQVRACVPISDGISLCFTTWLKLARSTYSSVSRCRVCCGLLAMLRLCHG